MAAIEQAVRRILEIQTAVRINPKHPTFDSFDYNTRGTVDPVGGVRSHLWRVDGRTAAH